MNSQWDERYKKSEYYYGTEANSFLKENSSLLPAGTNVLCLAEGEGRNAVYLAKLGYNVTAVDFSEFGLRKLRALAEKNGVNVETVCQDLDEFVFQENYWGGIVSIWCHLPSHLRKKVHSSVFASLKSGGIFLLEAYTPNQLKFKTGGPSNVDFMPTLENLKLDFKNLNPIIGIETTRTISEGTGHQGLSAVVQFILRK